MTFDDFKFHPDLADGLYSMGFRNATPIQEQAIPIILAHKDLIACAQTGTGKTAAYLLPILDKISDKPLGSGVDTLILAPTRELAQQIDQQFEGFGYFVQASSIAIYGGGDGAAWEKQKKALKEGADVIIATPGRLISLLAMGDLDLKGVKHLILDEADRMLDMGFYDDLIKIISYLPTERQTILFSATMAPKMRQLANTILKDPEQVNISISKPAEGILQQAYMVNDPQKTALILEVLKDERFQSIIIFCSTKDNVKRLGQELRKAGLPVKAFHSDLDQSEREEIMREFKAKKLKVLVGTDVLSRGIDVEGISLVINYDAPPDPEDYIHRIGRTARAETTGTAITFINDKDQQKFGRIEALIGKDIPKLPLPEGYPAGPEYNPNKRSSSGGGHRSGGGGGGKKTFFKKK